MQTHWLAYMITQMQIFNPKPYDLWIANLSSRVGNDTEKIRPVVILQTNLLEDIQPAVLICPLTSKIKTKPSELRINLSQEKYGFEKNSAIMLDKISIISIKRLDRKISELSPGDIQKLQNGLKHILDFNNL